MRRHVLYKSILECIFQKNFKIVQGTLQKYIENTRTKYFSKLFLKYKINIISIFYFENRNHFSEDVLHKDHL